MRLNTPLDAGAPVRRQPRRDKRDTLAFEPARFKPRVGWSNSRDPANSAAVHRIRLAHDLGKNEPEGARTPDCRLAKAEQKDVSDINKGLGLVMIAHGLPPAPKTRIQRRRTLLDEYWAAVFDLPVTGGIHKGRIAYEPRAALALTLSDIALSIR